MVLTLDNRRRIGFIGIGTLGKGLALALAAAGCNVVAAHSRTPSSTRWLTDRLPGCGPFGHPQSLADASDIVFITTPDSVIGEIAASIRWTAGQGVVHCSGASSLDVLRPAASHGARTGGFHPFQTFAGMDNPEHIRFRLQGVTFAIAGEDWLGPFLADLARDLGGNAITIADDNRSLYHAAAVLGCGHLSALLQTGVDCLREAGFTGQDAMDALVPLAAATLDNIRAHGVVPSITGPAVRGDVGTIQAHLNALDQRAPAVSPVYRALTAASLPIAAQRGVSEEHLQEMERLSGHYQERMRICPE